VCPDTNPKNAMRHQRNVNGLSGAEAASGTTPKKGEEGWRGDGQVSGPAEEVGSPA